LKTYGKIFTTILIIYQRNILFYALIAENLFDPIQ
jgi:hypothetical protein